jgi:hypothetical protein
VTVLTLDAALKFVTGNDGAEEELEDEEAEFAAVAVDGA